MIFDRLDNFQKYNFDKKLQTAFKLIDQTDFESLDYGIHEYNEDIKIVKMKFQTFYKENFAEIHFEHADIHLRSNLCDELVYFSEENNYVKEDVLNYNEQKDVLFVKQAPYQNKLILKNNTFALFWPHEKHKIDIQDHSLLEHKYKIIIKVKIS
ncbi:YhcH/YjgK/YiaL family protein [Mycoplasmopsis columboralis]|uniref:Beta-galactosidase-like protein n=1 Tax=Mycoplasmopsis columboralis TaxID=171282 RepID=A0A449B6X7_9BACT|nr:YhcH/YjgK/YiaL family protein [Mycoplasmopsis columboralis]VEU76367.1 beta-galactosidase-like protein [Mycoplasmopsis columboralis]